ncbi:uncharacterized protein LOC134254772 [Saccostrea cucullata]|uniref:uncharacterized protein LOC134254772 n=1 Tax=Saccostrea cuccullata TaxID=36930 RepID=UPI002ED3B60A
MFSYHDLDRQCLCCYHPPENIMNSSQWRTFIPPKCPSGYTLYEYSPFDICLKYVPQGLNYPGANASCNGENGDLIKIDTARKFEIFKNHLEVRIPDSTTEIWVQGVETDGIWRFHDGTLIPNACPLGETNKPNETHMRSISTEDFTCHDVKAKRICHYMCETRPIF